MAINFLIQVQEELVRTRALFPSQEENVSLHEWLPILVEEVGEVARDMNEHTIGNVEILDFLEHIQYELVQVAAMAARMGVAAQVQQRRLLTIRAAEALDRIGEA